MSTEEALARGDAAFQAGRWQEARAAFEAALREAGSPKALAGLGDAHFFLGDTRRSVQYRERAYATYRRAGNAADAVESAIWLCLVYQSCLGNRAVARGWLARAERLWGDNQGDLPRAWLDYCGAIFHADPDAGRRLIEKAVASARDLGDVDLELCGLAELGVVLVKAGEVDAGLNCVDEAMAGSLAGERTTPYTVVMTSCSMMTVCDLVGDLDRAKQWSSAADEFTRTYGCPYLYAECRILHGRVLVITGHWAEAEAELQNSVAATKHAFRGMYNRAIASLAELRLRQGRLDEAEALIDSVDAPVETALVAAALGLRRDDAFSAVALVERWLNTEADAVAPPLHAGGRGISIQAASAHCLLVDAHLAAGNLDAAAAVAQHLADLAIRSSAGYPIALAALARGRVAAANGRAEEVVRCFEHALTCFAEIELPLESARARVELARALFPGRPAFAIVEARSALLAFDRLGAANDADIAAALLRSWGAAGRAVPREAGELTRREQEVLALLAGGLSNQEIAERLYISRKTAAHHVSNLLTKLGVRSRAEAAAHAVRHDLLR
jgi:DNA-binding CsgD family transcriptional regulator/predicted negative regulator of RcsB-dependent stress response